SDTVHYGIGGVDSLELVRRSTGQLDRRAGLKYEDRTQSPAPNHPVQHTVRDRQQSPGANWQFVCSERLDDMTDIKRRHAPVLASIPQRDKIEILVRRVPGKIREALAPRVIRGPVHAAREALPQLNLKTVVVAPTGVINVIEAPGNERIQQEKIDRI